MWLQQSRITSAGGKGSGHTQKHLTNPSWSGLVQGRSLAWGETWWFFPARSQNSELWVLPPENEGQRNRDSHGFPESCAGLLSPHLHRESHPQSPRMSWLWVYLLGFPWRSHCSQSTNTCGLVSADSREAVTTLVTQWRGRGFGNQIWAGLISPHLLLFPLFHGLLNVLSFWSILPRGEY